MPKRTFFRLDEDKRERVIRSAIEEFRVNGYENAKIGTIAKNANIANGSIYQYFNDKRELFMYCVNWTIENFMRELDRQAPLAGLDLMEYIQSGVTERMAYWKQEPDLARFAHDLSIGAIGFPAGEENPAPAMYGAHIPKLIANGRKWGTIRDDVDNWLLEAAVRGIVRETEEMVYLKAEAADFSLSPEQMEENAALLRTINDILTNGLLRKGDKTD